MMSLAKMYDDGRGVERNKELAIYTYKKEYDVYSCVDAGVPLLISLIGIKDPIAFKYAKF